MDEENDMNWKRVISGVLAAAMLFALPVQLPVSAEGTEAVGQADGWEKLTTPEPLDECNAFFYSKDDQTFEKITHPEKDVKTADGIVDYLGDGAVAVVTDPEDAAYNAGDRGQNYAWSAVGYGDWLYVGTCYAAIGNTLSLMKSSLGDEYDDKVLAATFDALYNGTFFLTEEDGGRPKGVLVKINTRTGETKVLMSGSYNGYTPLFRNAVEYHGKLYFCGSVGGGGIGFLPSIWQVDPATDECKPVYIGLNSVQDYATAYQQGISVGIRGMCVYKDQLVVSNVTMDAATGKSSAALLISSDPEKALPRSRIPTACSTTPPITTPTASTAAASGIWRSTTVGCMCPSAPATRTICRTTTPCSPLHWCGATRMRTAPSHGHPWRAIRKRTVPATPSASTRSAPAPVRRT